MKKLLSASLLLILLFGGLSSSRAQGSGMSLQNWKDILVGPMFTAGASVNAGPVSDGTKTGSKFAFTGGVLLTYPWSPQIALDLGIGYESRGVNYHDQANDANAIDLSLGYLAIRPELKLGGFIIGLCLGLPMSVGTTYSGTAKFASGSTPTSSEMPFLVEGRIGGDIVLSSSDGGQLHLLIGAGYPFTKLLNHSITVLDDTKDNGPLASAQLGLTYLFDLTPH